MLTITRSGKWLTAIFVLSLASVPVIAAPPSGGGGGGKISVTAANPPEAFQGEELDVIVTGTGFEAGSTVSYLVTGTTDASQVEVLSVQVISSTELRTRIRPKNAALPTQYDIEVRTLSGRKGKGTTLFKVNLDPSAILPVDLGAPVNSSSSGSGLTDGAYPGDLIVTSSSSSSTPYLWQNGAWQSLGTQGNTTFGYSNGVSNNGTVVGTLFTSTRKQSCCTGVNAAFVYSNGSRITLPLLSGMVQGFAEGISADGQHVYGYNTLASQSTGSAVRWKRESGGGWSVELIGSPSRQLPEAHWVTTGSSDDGTVLVGYGRYGSAFADPALRNKYESWLWMEGGTPEWVSLGFGSRIEDIDPTGNLIVGVRYQDNGDTTSTPKAVYWTAGDGFTIVHDLITAAGDGSVARGVGRLANGDLVIVGDLMLSWGQPQSHHNAAAWLPQSSGGYGAPLILHAIKESPSQVASAKDVNANGVVVGYSNSGNGLRAVLWQLPGTP